MVNKKSRLFPMFVDIGGRKVLVVGGGTIASRRIGTLLQFDPAITVVALEGTEQITKWEEQGKIRLLRRAFQTEDLAGAEMVFAATNDRSLNEKIYRECRQQNIPVNISSDKELCDFHFPGVVIQEEITVGINASGKNHRKAKQARMAIEQCLQGEKIYE